jgi:hypothetical protein
MKRKFSRSLIALLGIALYAVAPAQAALGRATADFDNARPNRGETPYGRLVADSLRAAANADAALISAETLKSGTLKAGAIEQADVDALLSYGDDEVVTVNVTGAKLRDAFEQAVREYPTGFSGFLHGANISVTFTGQGGPPRVTSVRVNGRELGAGDSVRIAMPVGLANNAGYSKFWDGRSAARSNTKVRQAVANYITQRREVSPDATSRVAPR